MDRRGMLTKLLCKAEAEGLARFRSIRSVDMLWLCVTAGMCLHSSQQNALPLATGCDGVVMEATFLGSWPP